MNKFTSVDKVVIPAMLIPGFRSTLAIQNGVQYKLLFKTWGGIGDQICAEPTLRHAINNYKKCEIYLASDMPELYSHLKFKKVFDLRKGEKPVLENFFVLETITTPDDTNMVWQFFSHLLTNCVDFPSLCALRCQLPIGEKEVQLPDVGYSPDFDITNAIAIHAGKHWQSKTFPKNWWDRVISGLVSKDLKPVLIGANADDNRGTIDVDTNGCIDLRDKLSVLETISLLKKSKVLLTNDSSPLHMAVDSDCWIGYVATCKHPDHLTHWRKGQWGWRMKNLGKGGIWEILDYCPNKKDTLEVEFVGDDLLKWLPEPEEMVEWAYQKVTDLHRSEHGVY